MLQRVKLSCWIFGLALCSVAHSHDRLEPTVTNPGARSLALGGAFVAVADDATAAYANPAGLAQLLRPEISVEVRARIYEPEFPGTTISGVGFGSYVLPVKRWSLAVYVQTLADIEFPGYTDTGTGVVTLVSDLSLVNGGISVGASVSESVSLGLGLTFTKGSYASLGIDPLQNHEMISTNASSSRAGIIAGVLWTLNDRWAIGLAHRSGAEFDFEDGSPSDGPVTASLPRVTAAGARWLSPGGQATVAFEVEQLSGSGDRTRVHLGGEWVFLGSSPLVGLRAGLWHDPGIGTQPRDLGGLEPVDDVMHGSVGVGVAFSKVQLDFGVDVSEVITTASLSAIFSF